MRDEQKNANLSKMSKEEIAEIGRILMEDDLYKDIMFYAEERRKLMERYPKYPNE